MRNRTKPAPLRQALTAALDTEYAHAAKRKDLDRMAEVSAVSDALAKLWDGPVPTAESPAMPPPAMEPEPEPLPIPAAPGGMAGLSIRDIVSRIEPMPVINSMPVIKINDHGDRRRAARAKVQEAVAEVNRLTNDDQLRYELALMVVNDNIEAMGDLKDAAAAAGLPVQEYAKRVIATHTARRRRAAQVYAIEERALKNIDQAAGDAIEAIAERAVKDIRGET